MRQMRIYMGEKDHYKSWPLYEYIAKQCYKEGLQGVTVMRGMMGFGHKHHMHRNDFFALSGDLPVIVEVIDSAEKCAQLEELVRNLPFDGLITTAEVRSVRVSQE